MALVSITFASAWGKFEDHPIAHEACPKPYLCSMAARGKESGWEYIPPRVADAACLEERLGRFNDTPPGWEEISESEWAPSVRLQRCGPAR